MTTKLIKRLTPPIVVHELRVESDTTSRWYGWLFIRDKDGREIHAADLKPQFQDVFRWRPGEKVG